MVSFLFGGGLIVNTVGENIKTYRIEKGFTQKQLAEKINISENSIRRYELEQRTLTIDTLQLIATAVDVDINNLIKGVQEKILEIAEPLKEQRITNNNGYRIFTKDDYKRYRLSKTLAHDISAGYIEAINESWNKISKRFNFIIGVGQQDELMFYSAE